MKNVRIFALMIALTVWTVTMFAQQTSIGLRVGATYFTVNYDDFVEAPEYTMGLDVAIPVEFELSPLLSLQPELHFTQKGVSFDDIETTDIAIKVNYLELPVLLKANYGTDLFKCYAFAGPSVGYAINRFTVTKEGDDKESKDLDFVTSGEVQDQRWEIGVVGGIGGKLKAGAGHFVVDVRYALDLNDDTKFENDKPDDWEKATNRGCTLSVGYMLPIGGQ